ncbi:tetraspanin-5 [Callorhinchus milii]|uniref:Tetraspanin n=1 Tax=Callorhinchus milii TaxID=7868 RepID=V9KJ75_CALMI|nr:tetraspanin-5 [Callorhinchus milii]|eukprot:gi/632972637/ref/XP_007902757.1/ PREDICTED: tetraspanin-14 [Callorhinchus milii]
MPYHKYTGLQVSLLLKYTLFIFNILFWLVGIALLGVTFWAWSEKGVLNIQSISDLNGFDPVWILLVVGIMCFILGCTGCIGALRENICLLKFFSVVISGILMVELAAGLLGFVFQDWLKSKVQSFIKDNIQAYRDDIDLQNLIDTVQRYMQCCGAIDPEDWNNNIYFNCSTTNLSRERCGVPFSCCHPDPAQMVVNTQCGYDIRNMKKKEQESVIFLKGCIQAFEDWIPPNIYLVAGIFLGIACLQMFSIYLARSLISDIQRVQSTWRH